MGVAEKSSLLSKFNDNKQVCESKYKVEKIGVKLHPTTERQSLRQRILNLELSFTKQNNFVDDLIKRSDSYYAEDILSGITLCKSAKYLQKYGCLHSDHGADRWKF